MIASLPEWTSELTSNHIIGEDQLGVEGAAQGYQQELIPGIITTTDRARYYSFYAWVLYRFINWKDSSRLLKDFQGTFFKRHEVAFVLGAFSHHKDREIINGLVGSGNNNYKARTWWGEQDPITLDQNYFINSLGGFGQYYLTNMQAMGIIGANEHPSWVYPLTKQGEKLAQAYQESIGFTAYNRKLERDGVSKSISHADAIEYGHHGCLCPQSLASSADLPLLRDAFFRFDQQGEKNPHVRRRLALAVTLHLVQGANGQFKREMIRQALYLGEYLPGLFVPSSPVIEDWLWRWNLVEIRHMYTLGLQCLWAAFLLYLSEKEDGIDIPEYGEFLKQGLSQRICDLPVSDYLDEVCLNIGLETGWEESQETFALACSLDTGQDEYTAYLRALRAASNPTELLKIGMQILIQLFLRFRKYHLQNEPIWLEMALRERLPIKTFFDFFEDRATDKDVRVIDFLLKIYREMIWGQHEFVALGKLRYQDYDTFKFSYRDGRFQWPDRNHNYREPIRLSTNRLSMALSILNDMGLVSSDLDGCYSLSADGEEFLGRSLEAYPNDN